MFFFVVVSCCTQTSVLTAYFYHRCRLLWRTGLCVCMRVHGRACAPTSVLCTWRVQVSGIILSSKWDGDTWSANGGRAKQVDGNELLSHERQWPVNWQGTSLREAVCRSWVAEIWKTHLARSLSQFFFSNCLQETAVSICGSVGLALLVNNHRAIHGPDTATRLSHRDYTQIHTYKHTGCTGSIYKRLLVSHLTQWGINITWATENDLQIVHVCGLCVCETEQSVSFGNLTAVT